MGIFNRVGSFLGGLASGLADVVKDVGSALWSGVSGVLAFIFGGILWWVYYGIMCLGNIFKSRVALSACLKSVLKVDFPSVRLDEVRVVEDAVMVPRGRAMTEGHTIYFRDRFSEDKGQDLSDLMHELVHVRQFEKYDEWAFNVVYAYDYVNGFFSYEDSPLERETRDFVSVHFASFELRFKANCNAAYVPVSSLVERDDWAWLYW
jgi:hypothetical protein